MSRLGVTGHTNLTPDSAQLVTEALRTALTPYAGDGLIGISCVARGADSIFAQAIIDLRGQLEVVLPAANYRQTKVRPTDAPMFDALTRQAVKVTTMPFAEANRQAYQAANEELVNSCDRLFAIWDGQSPAGQGGTASVVRYARAHGVPVEIIWPEGARRG